MKIHFYFKIFQKSNPSKNDILNSSLNFDCLEIPSLLVFRHQPEETFKQQKRTNIKTIYTTMLEEEVVIAQTKKWITDVVIGMNFCPFAAKEVKQNTIRYYIENSADIAICVASFLNECSKLVADEHIETTLIIFPNAFAQFDAYLELVSLAEELIVEQDYEGVYQVASFHPDYCFADSVFDDAANYTNRSPYPMLHVLREESIEQALANYPNPDSIPERNINFAREKGSAYMKMLRDACLK
ncbi:MAG: DUF1415 domain-containing protein [Bacteroidota bacterium]|nr:DUF1415 domain-containing protein [Bacteroidota bacterium]